MNEKRSILAAFRRLFRPQTAPKVLPDQPRAPKLEDLVSHFPFELIETTGAQAYDTWNDLCGVPGETPIIVGTSANLMGLAAQFDPNVSRDDQRTPEEILKAADELALPKSLTDLRAHEYASLLDTLRQSDPDRAAALGPRETYLASIAGAWPTDKSPSTQIEPATLRNVASGMHHGQIFIARIPCAESAEVPAYLRLGNWGFNPPAEYHVAVWRDWQARFGATPVVVTPSVVEFQVARPPQTPEAALALARELYDYAPGTLVEQKSGSLAALGADLLGAHWWYVWWDNWD